MNTPVRYLSLFSVIIVMAMSMVACGPRKYSKGKYVDPGQEALLSDKFVETDLQKIAEELTESLRNYHPILEAHQQPVAMISVLTNSTDEHIDMLSLTNKIRTQIMREQIMRFVNERLRGELAEEYIYEESGYVDPALAKQMGHQLGVDYLLSGHISSIRQPVGRNEIVYYKTTMELTNLTTGELVWTDEVELKKVFKKRHVGQ